MSTSNRDPMILQQFTDGVRRFRWMGSPLYSVFCRHSLDDDELLALAAEAPPRQPFTHLLFAAVHMLILAGVSAPLAAYYASVTDQPKQDEEGAFAAFRAFCHERRSEIVAIMKSRTVQFTVAGRAAFVLPAVAYVSSFAGEPLSLIDIGCSAGLLTGFAHYAYDFGPDGRIGDPADLTITSFRFVDGKPSFLKTIPKIGQRVGIDLNPVDAVDPTERRWIDALCPPDMVEERRQLRAALDFRARTPFTIVKDDALLALPRFLATMPDPICVLATHCLYQWPQAARDALNEVFLKGSAGRSLYRITIDHPGALDPSRATPPSATPEQAAPMEHEAVLTVYRDGEASSTLLGRYDSYGRRGIWLAQDASGLAA